MQTRAIRCAWRNPSIGHCARHASSSTSAESAAPTPSMDAAGPSRRAPPAKPAKTFLKTYKNPTRLRARTSPLGPTFASKQRTYEPNTVWGRFDSIPRRRSADTALDAIDAMERPPGPVPLPIIQRILERNISLDALSRILPLLIESGQLISNHGEKAPSNSHVLNHLRALATYLASCIAMRAYIFVQPAVVEALADLAYLDKLDLTKDLENAAERVLARYHRLITILSGVHPEESLAPYVASRAVSEGTGTAVGSAPTIQHSIAQAVRQMLAALEAIGPEANISQRPSTASLLFGPALTTFTLKPLLKHSQDHGLRLSERQLRTIAMIKLRGRHPQQALPFLAQAANEEAERLGEPTDDVHLTHKLLAAMAASSFTDALRAVGSAAWPGGGMTASVSPPDVSSAVSMPDRAPRLQDSCPASDSSSPASTSSLSHAASSTTTASASSASASATSTPASTSTTTSTTPTASSTSPSPTSSSLASSTSPLQPPSTIPTTQDALRRSWSILMKRAVTDRSLTLRDIMTLANDLPEEAISSATLTPTIHAIMIRGGHADAVTLWNDTRERYARAQLADRPKIIDAALLSVAAEAKYRYHTSKGAKADRDPLYAAIRTVDYYARRPESKGYVSRQVPIDTSVVNQLLLMCVRDGRPSVALRIWAEAEERWEVSLDATSLRRILDVARYHRSPDQVSARMDALKAAIGFKPASTTRAPREQTRTFYDPKGYTWRSEYGSKQPWHIARAIFEQVLFSNWPGLKYISSPLSHSGVLNDITMLFSPPTIPPAPRRPLPSSTPLPFPIPGVTAPPERTFAHLVPDAKTWHAYISLLVRHFPEENHARAITWMRALDVRPYRLTMTQVLLHISENEGPRRRIRMKGGTRLMRDEEVVRAYLEDWLGAGAGSAGGGEEEGDGQVAASRKTYKSPVPTWEEVAAYRRKIGMSHWRSLEEMSEYSSSSIRYLS